MWEIEMTARSPISHRGELIGTTAIGRRMKIVQPDGSVQQAGLCIRLREFCSPVS
jgi:hypothetical protein